MGRPVYVVMTGTAEAVKGMCGKVRAIYTSKKDAFRIAYGVQKRKIAGIEAVGVHKVNTK